MDNQNIELELITKLLADTAIEVNFSEDEKGNLIKYYKGKELNQFALIIVKNLLEHKSFTESNEKVILVLTKHIADNIQYKENINDESIIQIAIAYYKFFWFLDIEAIYKNEF